MVEFQFVNLNVAFFCPVKVKVLEMSFRLTVWVGDQALVQKWGQTSDGGFIDFHQMGSPVPGGGGGILSTKVYLGRRAAEMGHKISLLV